jgi:ATP-dependent RNA helicase RhlE
MNFESLGLSEAIVRAVKEYGYTEPTPIQAQAIPAVLSGGDLLAGAQTGTGKTAGFVLPLLHRLSEKEANKIGGKSPIRALILTGRRECKNILQAFEVALYGDVWGREYQSTKIAAAKASRYFGGNTRSLTRPSKSAYA